MSTSTIRYFYRQETSGSGVERVFTVAYRIDKSSGSITYGASVFRRDHSSETFVKASHRSTATARLNLRPVRMTSDANSWRSIEDNIRNNIRYAGVSGDRS